MAAKSLSTAAVPSEMATSAMSSEPASAATVPTSEAAMATATVPSDMATAMAAAVRPCHRWLGPKCHGNQKQAGNCQQKLLAHHSSPKKIWPTANGYPARAGA